MEKVYVIKDGELYHGELKTVRGLNKNSGWHHTTNENENKNKSIKGLDKNKGWYGIDPKKLISKKPGIGKQLLNAKIGTVVYLDDLPFVVTSIYPYEKKGRMGLMRVNKGDYSLYNFYVHADGRVEIYD